MAFYALSFAAPLASGVVGMVAAGMWSDRKGPTLAMWVSMVLFSVGLVVCGTAPAMEVFVAGRVLQGLGGGALTVCVYVLVGQAYEPRLQPSIFAAFATAWVLPSLFGPALAAWIAHVLSWRWVFLGAVALVLLAAVLVAPTTRGLKPPEGADEAPRSRLWWAIVGAVAVLAFELLGSRGGWLGVLALASLVAVFVALRRLLPPGSLRAAHGLPAVIVTRGFLAAGFFGAEAYIVFVLQEQWGASPGEAGMALTVVGIVWALSSQLQARLGKQVNDEQAMIIGASVVFVGVVLLALVVWLDGPAMLAGASYVLAGAGMGFGYPRTGVAMLAASSDADRGFNSSALSVADSLGAALALSGAGVAFAAARSADTDPFIAVFALASVLSLFGVLTAVRTRPLLTPVMRCTTPDI